MATTGLASASLYIGDLNNDVNEQDLFEMFSQVGSVASIRVCRDAITKRSLGYGYVNFHNLTDAERALDTLNFNPIKNRPCRIMWSQRDPSIRKSGVGNIFIKNLEKTIDNKELYDTFSMFGNILSAKIALSPNGESLGYGFVHFDSDEAAAKAIDKVNGMLLKDMKVIVTAFKPKDVRGGVDKTKFTNIYVKDLPEDFTQDKFDALFSQFGKISHSVLITRVDGKNEGKKFGFVNYETSEMANAAVQGAHHMDVEGRQIYVSRAQKKSEREKELRDKYETMKQALASKFIGVNLYIKNLSDDMNETDLQNEFGKFGNITSARIMRDEATNRSRLFGFVCFSHPDEANRAVTEMHGKMLNNKPLYVSMAMRKDLRRQQLEAMRKGMIPQVMYGPPSGPMFYAPAGPGMGRQFPMYPQMMPPMGRGYGPRGPFPGPMGPGPRAPSGSYAVMPVNPMAPGMAGNRGPRPPRAPQQGGVPGQAQQGAPRMQQGGQPQRQGGAAGGPRQGGQRYNDNRGGQKPRGPEGGAAVVNPQAPLNASQLASAPAELQKQMIGERLFPLIAVKQPELAGKITGMLLEMDNAELLELLDSEEACDVKINEALRVLQEAELAANASS